MRPPRFQFTNEIRETTRTIASRMVGDGTIAQTSEELGAWIEQRPEVREPLELDGYGTEFTAEDLFPLLQVFVVQAGGSYPEADAPPGASRRRWALLALVAAAVVLAVVLAVVAAPAISSRAP